MPTPQWIHLLVKIRPHQALPHIGVPISRPRIQNGPARNLYAGRAQKQFSSLQKQIGIWALMLQNLFMVLNPPGIDRVVFQEKAKRSLRLVSDDARPHRAGLPGNTRQRQLLVVHDRSPTTNFPSLLLKFHVKLTHLERPALILAQIQQGLPWVPGRRQHIVRPVPHRPMMLLRTHVHLGHVQ